MRFKDQIPNLVTLLNLICGSIAIIMVFSGRMSLASWLIILAAFFDFIDGFVARMLNARSEIGANLDSLADVVSFGLAPSLIIFKLFPDPSIYRVFPGIMALVPYLALLIAVAGAFRLAKFNSDPGQADVFKGLPIPATGLFIASLPLILEQSLNPGWMEGLIRNPITLILIITSLSGLMISSIPMMSLKFKNIKWNENANRIILILSFPCMFLFLRFAAIPLVIMLYILLSIAVLRSRPSRRIH
jgi:CDP-diacylglycerol--serine O-phosphatidyltransferase